ncbi:unnamed protein product [Closterium sp. NIES-53]
MTTPTSRRYTPWNLVGASHLYDLGVVTTFPLDEFVSSCTDGVAGAPLASFPRELGSGLYSLHTGSRRTGSGQVRSGLLESLAPLPRSPAPLCTPCVEGRQRAARHSSLFPPTTAPFQTLHLDADVPTVLEPWLLARGGAQGLCGLRLHSDRGGEFSSTHLEMFYHGRGILQSYTLPASLQQNGVAERRVGLVMEVARTSMCHAGAPQFLWPQAVRYAAHQLNLWPSDARPRVTPISLWTGSPSVAADFHVWGSLAYLRTPGANKLSPRTRAYAFLGFPLDASGWVFYDSVTYEFFASQDVTFDESVCYYRIRPHRGVPQSSPPQRLAPVVSGGAGGAVAEGEGTGAAGAGGVGSGAAGGVGVEATPVEDMAALTQWPRLTSPPGFPSVPQFPSHSSLRPVVAEPGGVLAGGTGGPGGVGGGGAGSGGAGAGGTRTVAPTPRTVRFQTHEQRLLRLEREERERFERAQQQQQQSQSHQQERVEERVEQESRPQQQVQLQTQQERVDESQPQQERAEEEPQEQQEGQVLSQQTPEEAEWQRLRLRDLPDPAPARLVRGPLPSPPVPSCSPHRVSFLVPVDSFPPDTSLTVFHDPLSDYLRASRPLISRVLSALVTHPTTPLLSVSALVTTIAGFASSHCLDYAAHLVSGPAQSPSSGGAPVFPLEVLKDRQFELGFLAVAVPPLCALLLAPEGDPDALDIPILPPPGTNVVSGQWLYKVKQPPGSPPMFKARYVARGFSQREGVDFFQTFAPTPKMTTLRVLLHIGAQRDYELHSLDFLTAFLQGSLHEQIWLRRPPGFTGSFPPGTQWQLCRPVYGLRQAPREWHDTLRSTLAALDFFPSSADPSLFVRRGSTPFFFLVYVDDLILTQFRFPFSKVQLTPLAADHGLTAPPSDESFESSGPYPEPVGCLMYLMTCTRPDLAYPLSVLAHFVAPGRHRPSHWYATKRVAKYVATTSSMGLFLGGKLPFTLTGFSDSSWADDAETRRSTQEYSFSLGIGVVSWWSTRASSVSGSSCESEVYAAVMATQELRWLTFLLTNLGERPRSPLVSFVDNRYAVLLCEEPRLVGKAKHIQLCYFLMRELQQHGQALVRRVVSEANTADIFTKALPPCNHQRFCTQLGLGHWSTAELQGTVTRIGEVGKAAVDLGPVLVTPHREAAPQLAAGTGDVWPLRHRRELQRANLLPVFLLVLLGLLVVERQLDVGVDRDRRLWDAPGLLLVDEPPTQ